MVLIYTCWISKFVVIRRVFRTQNGQKCVGGGDPAGEFTALPQAPSWTKGRGGGREKVGRGRGKIGDRRGGNEV